MDTPKKATYVGDNYIYQGHTALVREDVYKPEQFSQKVLLVQFDDQPLQSRLRLTKGWHLFVASDWKVDNETS